MIGGINGNNTLNWFALLATQKNQAANSSQKTSGSSGDEDSAEISLMTSGQGDQRADPLEQLVNDGTITNDQASAIGQALQSAMQSGQTPGTGADPLANLVSSGTITQDQANSVKSALQASAPGKEQNSFMSNVLNNLVSSGTITQDQADSVQQALQQAHHHHRHHHGTEAAAAASSSGQSSSADSAASATGTSSLSGRQYDPLGSLVTNGTITQDQESAIQSAFKQAFETGYAISAYAQSAAAE